jgi:hypothetical protein
MFQTTLYWSMGALTNDGPTLARYAAFYKSIQSAGAAVAWGSDNSGMAYMDEVIVNWVLTSVALVLVFIVASRGIRETEITLENLPLEQQLAEIRTVDTGMQKDIATGGTALKTDSNDYVDDYADVKPDDGIASLSPGTPIKTVNNQRY